MGVCIFRYVSFMNDVQVLSEGHTDALAVRM
jgi:hypothetical protein